MRTRKAILHIGKHKTGTTSFQAYVNDEKDNLAHLGILVVPMDLANFTAACLIRDRLPIPPLKTLQRAGVTPTIADAHARLGQLVSGKDFETLLLSSEHYSFFREQSEIDALRNLLLDTAGIRPEDTSICLVNRKPEDFLRSYTAQIIKSGHGKSKDRTSPYYCEPDSWLVDDATIKALWAANFPRLDVLEYEGGNIVPRLCSVMGIPMNEKAEQYNLNQRVGGVRGWIHRNVPFRILKIARIIRRRLPFRV